MRSWRWGFKRDSDADSGASQISLVSLLWIVVLGFLIGLACFTGDWHSDGIVVAVLVGVLLGVVAGFVSPLLSIAMLGATIKPSPLIVAVVIVSLPGLLFASMFGMPGPGAASANYFYGESIVASVSTLLPLIVAYCCWRHIGVRLQQV